MRPVNAALGCPTVAVVANFFVSLRKRQRNALSLEPACMSRCGCRSGIDSNLHALALGAATRKIRKVRPPTAILMRNENCKIMPHDRPQCRHKTLKIGSYVVSDFQDFKRRASSAAEAGTGSHLSTFSAP